MDLDVTVVGAGISGLTTAHRLLELDPGLRVTVLEATGRAGGTLGTEAVEGFTFERGPNGFLDNVPYTLELARELGLGERILASSDLAKHRFVLKRGRLLPVPTSPGRFLRSPLLSARGRLRVLLEPFQGRGRADLDESVASFGRRRLGAEATATLLDPFVTGIYAGDLERISLASAFPRLAALEREHGGLFRGMRARAKERQRAGATGEPAASPAGPGGRLRSFPGGLEELGAALAARLGPRLRLAVPVESVRRTAKGDGYEVLLRDQSALRSQDVIIAVPAPRAAVLVSSWNPDLAMALEELPYAAVAVVCLGYPRSAVRHPLDGFGFLIPRDQGLRTLGVIFVSSLFPAHAPEGTVSLRALVGGARDPEAVGLAEGELEALVVREVGPVLGFEGGPRVRKIYRYLQGIPQYNVGHAKRLARIDGWLARLPGLHVTGNAYRGIGINDCVAEAARLARQVIDQRQRRRSTAVS